MSTARIMLAIALITVIAALVVAFCLVGPASAAGPDLQGTPPAQTQDCSACHADRVKQWESGKHAQAFSTDAFQKLWADGGKQKYCLTCHTTGYDTKADSYVAEGVTCLACHKQAGDNTHPEGAMTVSSSAEFCGTCHVTTLHEWQQSGHGKANIACTSCHDMHSASLRETPSGDLCTNCHKERNVQAVGMPMSTVAQCANCHMFTQEQVNKQEGKGPTGHSFVMGSDACQRCHKDNIHTAHQVEIGATPQPGTDKPVVLPTQPATNAAPSGPTPSSNTALPGTAGGALSGLLVGFAAAALIVRRSR